MKRNHIELLKKNLILSLLWLFEADLRLLLQGNHGEEEDVKLCNPHL